MTPPFWYYVLDPAIDKQTRRQSRGETDAQST